MLRSRLNDTSLIYTHLDYDFDTLLKGEVPHRAGWNSTSLKKFEKNR